MTKRIYPFPFRTRKSSSSVPMILLYGGKVGRCQLFYFKLVLHFLLLLFINHITKGGSYGSFWLADYYSAFGAARH